MIQIANMAGTARAIQCRKVIVKLGSAVVMGADQRADERVIGGLADAIVSLHAQKVDVIVVTSGSIGIGCTLLGRPRPKTLPEKQALAAVGQITLMHLYQEVLGSRGLHTAQLLLTRGDMEDRKRYLNARYTLERLLALRAVPIINENDTIATEEIGFGDNDTLSAYVAVKMKADLLILLSSVEGLMAPSKNGGKSEPIRIVEKVDGKAYELVQAVRSSHGTGGMKSKLDAAKIACEAGVHTVIAGGKTAGIVDRIFTGNFVGTYFPASEKAAISARERWIGFGRSAKGNRIHLDAGAVEAILRKKTSLLPVGVVSVSGQFARGDLVDICDAEGRAIARGLTNYSSGDVEKIRGRKTSEIASVLGECNYEEIVHRDNMALLS
jgi:glutamate 5-kinase